MESFIRCKRSAANFSVEGVFREESCRMTPSRAGDSELEFNKLEIMSAGPIKYFVAKR